MAQRTDVDAAEAGRQARWHSPLAGLPSRPRYLYLATGRADQEANAWLRRRVRSQRPLLTRLAARAAREAGPVRRRRLT